MASKYIVEIEITVQEQYEVNYAFDERDAIRLAKEFAEEDHRISDAADIKVLSVEATDWCLECGVCVEGEMVSDGLCPYCNEEITTLQEDFKWEIEKSA